MRRLLANPTRTAIVAATAAISLAFSVTLWAEVVENRGTGTSRASLSGPERGLSGPVAIQEGKRDPTGREGSGGRAVVHRQGGKELRSRRLTRTAPEARLYRTGFGSFEPTMGITESGAVFFNGLVDGPLFAEPIVVRSTDEGASWEIVFDGHPTTNDPYLYVDPATSRVFANDFLVPGCHLISLSDDDGETWTTSPPAGCIHNADHQTIFAGPPPAGGAAPTGYPNVVYLCSIGGGISLASTASVCSKSLDGGTTFVPTGEPAFVDDPRQEGDLGIPGLCNGANAHGFVGPDGTVYLPRGWCGQPWLATSEDEGLTWTRVQVADNSLACCGAVEEGIEFFSHEAGVVADEDGNVYYTWVAGDRLPYLAVSRDGGATWGEPRMIAPPGIREALLPGIALGASGKVAIQYMGSPDSPWNGREAKGTYDDATWNGYITMTDQALAKDPVFYSAPINDPREPLMRGQCGPDPVRCNWGDFFDVVIGADGTPWSVAVDLCVAEDCDAALGEGVIGRLVGGPSLR